MPTADSKGPQTAQQQLQKDCKSRSGSVFPKTPLSLGFEWSIESLKLEKGGGALWGPAKVVENGRQLSPSHTQKVLVNAPLWLH